MEQPHAALPWHRRYRIYFLIPLVLGYAIIYGCRNAPLRVVDRTEVQHERQP